MVDGGKRLFPDGPLADVAAEILAYHEVPGDLVAAALDSFGTDPFGTKAEQLPALRKEISNLATLIGGRRLLTDQLIAPLLGDPEWREKMLAEVKVNWRAVRRVPVSQNEDNRVVLTYAAR